MKKIIIIKYAELSTKKDNINFFITSLKANINTALKEIDHVIKYDKGRMFIVSEENNFDKIIEKLKNVFGIHEFFVGYEIESTDLEEIGKITLELLKEKEFKTFKVNTKRSNKNYPIKSPEFSARLGEIILNNLKVKVDIKNPDLIMYAEIRSNESFIYFDKIKGLGGYPVSTLGKGLLMLSGGIDSPVAGYMAMKRGVKIEAIYFEAIPHTSLEAREKVISLARKLATYNNDIRLHIINFTEIQEAIYKEIPHEYLITIMRRMMYRISSIVAYKQNCKVVINGESIGQVASQTLTSMEVINSVIEKPVIRPLACLDKLEIISIAKKIDTYDISILPYEDCCTVFVPDHPVINPKKEEAVNYEELIPYEDMIFRAVVNRKIMKISAKEENSDLL